MHQEIIYRLLSRPDINVFDEYIRELECYFNRTVTTVSEMRERDSKKLRGDLFEQFCRDWLIASGQYLNVWLLKDYCSLSGANLPKQDNGIDLIGFLAAGGWVAIQCKYRNSRYKRLDWKTLSTFIGLCERTGPWVCHLIMTNCRSITNKLTSSPKDKYLCLKTFQNTSREHWMKMVGTYHVHRLTDEPIINEIKSTDVDLETIRTARLARFDV